MRHSMKNYIKFGVLITAIIGSLAWLAVGGISETKTYYKTIAEVHQMGNLNPDKKIRVGGDVAPHSIVREGREVRFVLAQDNLKLPVVYSGIDPLPDTFKDGAQALADGKLGSDGIFR